MNRFRFVVFCVAVCFSLFVGTTSFMPETFYSSAVWSCIWFAVLVLLLVTILRSSMWKNPPVFLLHLAFVSIISGGFLTSIYSYSGTIHLSTAQPIHSFVDTQGISRQLPSEITLVSFDTEYYSGMTFPKDFRSEVAVATGDTMRISMNHIGKLDGFRFYQTSFDGVGGSILTVCYDPFGMVAVYLGFLMFALGGGWLLFKRIRFNSRTLLLLLSVVGAGLCPQEIYAVPAVSRQTADSLSYRQVLYNGDVIPFNTVATRLTYKLTGKNNVGELSPEQFVISLIRYREEWSSPWFAIIFFL